MKKILVLYAHPAHHKSKVNSEMVQAVSGVKGITVHKLYLKYPDFHIDIEKEQQLLLEHDVIVWQHPFYWYSAPALVKEWIDLVLEHNFAYGKKGRALEGKTAFNVITTGGRQEAYQSGGYNQYTIQEFLAPFRQTIKLCHMNVFPPYVVHGTHLLTEDRIKTIADHYHQTLVSVRDELFEHADLVKYQYLNDVIPEKIPGKIR